MKIGFFGTCANDDHLLFESLKTIKNQTYKPFEIVIVDFGKINKKVIISKILKKKG